jgi:hypothetical protein
MSEIPVDEILIMLCADLEADGSLAPDQRAALVAVLAKNPHLKELYESFRLTRDPLARPFEAALEAAVPERLLRTLCDSPSPRSRSTAARRGWPSLAWLGDLLRAPALSPATAIPALAVSIAVGWLLNTATGGGATPHPQGPIASAELRNALEVTPSRVEVTLARGVRLEPRFTFATEDKVWCRQYKLTYPENLEAGGVACRGSDGVWQVLMQTALTARQPQPPPDSVFTAAPPPSDSEKALDGVRGQLKRGEVLGGEEEAECIAGHWKQQR